MKLGWLFNGTMEAHHLLASYLIVWTLQGGYAAWVGWKRYHLRATLRPTNALTSISRDRK